MNIFIPMWVVNIFLAVLCFFIGMIVGYYKS